MSFEDEIIQLIQQSEKPPNFQPTKGATSEQIDAAESILQWKIPPILKAWLQFCNGTVLGPGGIFGVFCDIQEVDVIEHWQRIAFWKTEELIPIAGDGCGNYYAIPIKSSFGMPEPIIFIEMLNRDDLDARFFVASDTLHLVKFLLLKELGENRWPFDREFVVSLDAMIEKASGSRLPWSPTV